MRNHRVRGLAGMCLVALLVAGLYSAFLAAAEPSSAQLRTKIAEQEKQLTALRQRLQQAVEQRHTLELQEYRLVRQVAQLGENSVLQSRLANVRAKLRDARQAVAGLEQERKAAEGRLASFKNTLRQQAADAARQREAASQAAEEQRAKEKAARQATKARRVQEAVEQSYLTVRPTPAHARVKILNIGPRYRDGIPLTPGRYDIQVSAPGYQTDRRWHTLPAGRQDLAITLDAEPSAPPRQATPVLNYRPSSRQPTLSVVQFEMGEGFSYQAGAILTELMMAAIANTGRFVLKDRFSLPERSSLSEYRSDAPAIGSKYGLDAIITGRVYKLGGLITVTAWITYAHNGSSYSGQIQAKDMDAIQSKMNELATIITGFPVTLPLKAQRQQEDGDEEWEPAPRQALDTYGCPVDSGSVSEAREKCADYIHTNYSMAFSCCRFAAQQGDPVGQSNLGFMYDNGRGIAQDSVEAVRWYRKAAEQGLAMGQNNLGFMYENGRGVAQDYVEAVRWYRKAAEQGLAMGQNNLGNMYRLGKGVRQNIFEAARWFRKAAAQGDPDAMNNLNLPTRNK